MPRTGTTITTITTAAPRSSTTTSSRTARSTAPHVPWSSASTRISTSATLGSGRRSASPPRRSSVARRRRLPEPSPSPLEDDEDRKPRVPLDHRAASEVDDKPAIDVERDIKPDVKPDITKDKPTVNSDMSLREQFISTSAGGFSSRFRAAQATWDGGRGLGGRRLGGGPRVRHAPAEAGGVEGLTNLLDTWDSRTRVDGADLPPSPRPYGRRPPGVAAGPSRPAANRHQLGGRPVTAWRNDYLPTRRFDASPTRNPGPDSAIDSYSPSTSSSSRATPRSAETEDEFDLGSDYFCSQPEALKGCEFEDWRALWACAFDTLPDDMASCSAKRQDYARSVLQNVISELCNVRCTCRGHGRLANVIDVMTALKPVAFSDDDITWISPERTAADLRDLERLNLEVWKVIAHPECGK